MIRFRRRLRWFVVAGLAILLLITLGGVRVGVGAVQVRDDLATAGAQFQRMEAQFRAGDIAGATRTMAGLRRSTRAAADTVRDPGWGVVAGLPGPGNNLAAVRTVATALADVADNAMPPLMEAVASLEAAGLGTAARAPGPMSGPLSGPVVPDLSVLRASVPRFEDAHTVFGRALDRIEAIPAAGLTRQIETAVGELRRRLRQVVALTDAARRAAAVLPTMLGADGPRTYLLLFQNLAEVRASGGMPGAFAVVGADKGRLSLVAQGTASIGMAAFEAPVLPVDAEQQALYGTELASHPANINLTPHFPTTAALAREMYRRRSGRTVDGVIATDPVVLSYLLRATGPVSVPGGETLTPDNAVRFLLSEVYARYPTREQQDAYFARAAQATFEALVRGAGDWRALLAALAQSVAERRLLLWSARPEEQAVVDGTAVGGMLPTDDTDAPVVGVFLNDGGGSKLGYYLAPSAEITELGCGTPARREYSLRVTLGSSAPRSGLPEQVLSYPGVPDRYATRVYVSVFAPVGWGIVDATRDGAEVGIASGAERGRSVARMTLDVPPGGGRGLTVKLLALGRRAGDPTLWTTPTITPWRTKAISAHGCVS